MLSCAKDNGIAIFILANNKIDNWRDRREFGNIDVLVQGISGKEPDRHRPEHVIKTAHRNPRSIACFVPLDREIDNYELTKDFGAIPYLFMREKGWKVYLVGAKDIDEYSYYRYVSGIELIKLRKTDVDHKLEWLRDNISNIDGLFLFGTYLSNMALAREYRRIRKDGFIYLALDANSFWVDHIPRWDKECKEFYENCDLISTTTDSLSEFIEEKWDLPIEVIRCGFYDFGAEARQFDFDNKQDEILFVGRVGAKEKRTDLLLNAFLKVSTYLPEWKLVLVGSVEESFLPVIESFLSDHEELRDRIELTGSVEDKARLHRHFENAKILAISSESEGFPNVVPEAMSAGCAIVTTKVDNYIDFIQGGEIGVACDINDEDGFAQTLRDLCENPVLLKKMCAESYNTFLKKYDYVAIVDKLYKLIESGSDV